MKNRLLTAKYRSLMSNYLSGKLRWKYGDELYLLLQACPMEYIILLEDSMWLRGHLTFVPEATPWEIRNDFIQLDEVIDINFSFRKTMLVFLHNGYLLVISPTGRHVAYICAYPRTYADKEEPGKIVPGIKPLIIEIRLWMILLRWYFYE